MNIVIGKYAGFCAGVSLCVKRVNEELKNNNKLYCIGDVVHNKDVVNDLKNKGLIVVSNENNVPDNSRCVIRAHGCKKELYDNFKNRNIEIIDLTCPKVLKIRDLIHEYINKDNYLILLFGEANHPEIISTYSFCGNNAKIIESSNDLESIIDTLNKYDKVIVIEQTTFNIELFNKYIDILNSKLNNLEIINTICNATKLRQDEVLKLSKECDCMIIIGGINSSNTKKLYEISKLNCSNTYHCENINDLNLNIIKRFNNIGIMAGASTPSNIIDEVYNSIKTNK